MNPWGQFPSIGEKGNRQTLGLQHAYDPCDWKVETRGSKVQGQPRLRAGTEANLRYLRTFLKTRVGAELVGPFCCLSTGDCSLGAETGVGTCLLSTQKGVIESNRVTQRDRCQRLGRRVTSPRLLEVREESTVPLCFVTVREDGSGPCRCPRC